MQPQRVTTESLDLRDWLTLEDAADLMELGVRSLCSKASAEFTQATKTGRAPLAVQAPPPSGIGRPCWYVHRKFHPALTVKAKFSDIKPLESRYPLHHVEAARNKFYWLNEWLEACKTNRFANKTKKQLAQEIVARAKSEQPEIKISVRSLEEWKRRYSKVCGDGTIAGIEGLIPGYGSGGGGDDGDNDRNKPVTRSKEAIEFFYDLFHHQNQISMKMCHDYTLREATLNGWSWPASYQSTATWIKKYDDEAETCLHREGETIWRRKYSPFVENNYYSIRVGQIYQSDHAQFDFWCVHEGKQIRPWITAFEDMRSRKIVGWHIGTSPNQDAIIRALKKAIINHGVPEKLYIDNGKDYTSQAITGYTKKQLLKLRSECKKKNMDWRNVARRDRDRVPINLQESCWKGVAGELGIKLKLAQPYNWRAKGEVERFFGTMHGQFDKLIPTYCGRSPENKPEVLQEIKDGYSRHQKKYYKKQYGVNWQSHLKLSDQTEIPSLEETRELFEDYLTLYHNNAHQGDAMDGHSPNHVWSTAVSLRKAHVDEVLFLLNSKGNYKVGANGISLKVGGMSISYGRGSNVIAKLKGREVNVVIDPDDISYCWVFTPDGDRRRPLGKLFANRKLDMGTTTEDARAVAAEINHLNKQAKKAKRDAPERTKSGTRKLRERMVAQAKEQQQLQATGTDEFTTNIIPVQTGFEAPSSSELTYFDNDSNGDGFEEELPVIDPGKWNQNNKFEDDDLDDDDEFNEDIVDLRLSREEADEFDDQDENSDPVVDFALLAGHGNAEDLNVDDAG